MEKKRILIVDDEPTFTKMVKLNLEQTGDFEVREEHRATAALATAREFKPHLVLLDVIMPSMDGGDLASLNSGGSLFLAKPVSLDHLIKCIHERTKKPEPAPQATEPGKF